MPQAPDDAVRMPLRRVNKGLGKWLKSGGLWLARVQLSREDGAKTSSELDGCQYTNSPVLKEASEFRGQ